MVPWCPSCMQASSFFILGLQLCCLLSLAHLRRTPRLWKTNMVGHLTGLVTPVEWLLSVHAELLCLSWSSFSLMNVTMLRYRSRPTNSLYVDAKRDNPCVDKWSLPSFFMVQTMIRPLSPFELSIFHASSFFKLIPGIISLIHPQIGWLLLF